MKYAILSMPCLAVVLSSCSMINGAGIVDKKPLTYCDGSPIYIGREDALTDKTADQIASHNEIGAKECMWRSKDGA